MKNVQTASVQVFGYMRVIAFAIMTAIMLFATMKGEAIAPHMPDIAHNGKLELHRKKAQEEKERKAADKVKKHREHKERRKKEKKAGKPKNKKEKKPPRPHAKTRKHARNHNVKNIH